MQKTTSPQPSPSPSRSPPLQAPPPPTSPSPNPPTPPQHPSPQQSSHSPAQSITPPASPPHKRPKHSNPLPPPPVPCNLDQQRWHYAPHLHPASFYPSPHPYHQNMPHRVDDVVERSYGHHSDNAAQYQYMHSHPTPPPIATLHNSPALSASSLESSSISPSPPQLSQPSTPYYTHPGQGPAMNPSQAYPYNPNVSMGARYANDMQHHQGSHPGSPFTTSAHIPGQVSTRSIRPTFVPTQPYPGQASYIIHTDDASTKLSDRVRRRCYNCRTTDTSTWRRSSLTPGKVLCNKCGLFERTHSRPRPEQFPHKRGPIVSSSFKSSRTPPPVARLPPMSATMHPLPPHHYNHPSLGPLMSTRDSQNHYRASAVPDIGNLLNGPTDGPPGAPGSNAQEAIDGGAQKRPLSPAQSPRGERRDAPSYRSSN